MRVLLVILAMVGLTGLGYAQTPAPATETPTELYVRFRAAVQQASTIDQVLVFLSSDVVDAFKAAPSAERIGLNEIKAAYAMMSSVKVLKESATPNHATLILQGTTSDKKAMTAEVNLIRENGTWKVIDLELWK